MRPVSVLIVDEVQLLKNNESLLNFAFNFANTNKVLLVMVGTPESVTVLEENPRFMRRAEAPFDTELQQFAFPNCTKEEYNANLANPNWLPDPWTWFLLSFWDRQFTSRHAPLTYDFSLELHSDAVGIPSYAVKLFAAAQLKRIGTSRDWLDSDALKEANTACTKVSKAYLDALREKNYLILKRYADFNGIDWKAIATKAAETKPTANKNTAPSPAPSPSPAQPVVAKKDAPKAKPLPVDPADLPRAPEKEFL